MAEVTVHTSNDQFCNDAAVRIFWNSLVWQVFLQGKRSF
jgi:hypothetical protein